MNFRVFFLIFVFSLFFSGCSTSTKSSNRLRLPASSIKNDCYKIIKNIFLEQSNSKLSINTVSKRVQQIEKGLLDSSLTKEHYEAFLYEMDSYKGILLDKGSDDLISSYYNVYHILLEGKRLSSQGEISSFVEKNLPTFKDIASKLDLFKSSKVAVVKEKEILELEKIFFGDLHKLGKVKTTQMNSEELLENLENYLSYTYLKSPGRILEDRTEEESTFMFSHWLKNNYKKINNSDSHKTLYDHFHEQKSLFLNEVKDMGKSDLLEISVKAKEGHLESYNIISAKLLSEIESVDDLKKSTINLLHQFKALDSNFRYSEFESYLRKNNFFTDENLKKIKELSLKNEEYNFGRFLQDSYLKFAPYAATPIKEKKTIIEKLKETAMKSIGMLEKEVDTCSGFTCIFKKAKEKIEIIFKPDFYRRSFSCMTHNPVVMKNLVVELGITWSAIYTYYKMNSENYERFPYEIFAHSLVFAPIMNEANCRASFKSHLNFGDQILKQTVLQANSTKVRWFAKNLTSLTAKGTISTLGLIAFTMSADRIALALGESILRPAVLSDTIKMLPFMLLYNSVWKGTKDLLIVNPLRHKIIPRITESFAKKVGLNKAIIGTAIGLDIALFYYISQYNEWEYLRYYRDNVLPKLMNIFGLTPTNVEEETDKREVDFDVEKVVSHENIKESEDEIVAETKLSNGVETKMIIEKLPNGEIRIKEVEVNAPDEVIDQITDSMVSPNGN